MTASQEAKELTRVASAAADAKGGADIVAFDVSEQLAITDVFVVCSVANAPQMRAVTDEVEVKMHQAGAGVNRREGERESSWVLMDFGDVVVHVQLAEDREFYGLDRLWSDCPQIELA